MYTNTYVEETHPYGYTPIDIYTNVPYVLIKNGDTPIAEIIRDTPSTSKGVGNYYIFKANVAPEDREVCIPDDTPGRQEKTHNIYSSINVATMSTDFPAGISAV